ncbi:MAG: hypothetical protein RLZZ324_178, partial [Candidatus Parcubacteria bacterium]
MHLTADWFKGKRVTVMGLGVHGGGLGSAKWLMRRGAHVTVTDLQDQHALAASISELERTFLMEVRRRGKLNIHRIRYVLGRHDEADFARADMVIRNPAVPRKNPFLAIAIKSGVPVESDISIFFALCPFPISAISGTKGKTTTTKLLAAICAAHDKRTAVGGNLRISSFDSLDRLLKIASSKSGAADAPPVVLELSSWQLESVEHSHKHGEHVHPHVGILTNVAADHLDRYDGIDDYARAKELLIAFQKEGDIAVVNADDARIAAMGRKVSAVKGSTHGGGRLWYSLRPLKKGLDGAFVRGGKAMLRVRGTETALFPLNIIRMPGEHNVSNVLAAALGAVALGIPRATLVKAIKAFGGVPGRLQEIAVKNGIRFVNDTASTSPGAGVAALVALGAARHGAKKGASKNIVLIAGGADKDSSFTEWAAAAKKHVKHLVLFDGAGTVKMEAAMQKAGVKIPAYGAR